MTIKQIPIAVGNSNCFTALRQALIDNRTENEEKEYKCNTSVIYRGSPFIKMNGQMRNCQEFSDYIERKGLCPICGQTKVKKYTRKGLFSNYNVEPLTITSSKKYVTTTTTKGSGSDNEYLVYKGYCLVGEVCYTLEEAMRDLGEI